MYSPSSMKISDTSVAHQVIDEFGFGLIVSTSLTGTHLPFVLHPDEGELGVLYSHCAKANPHWSEFLGTEVLLVFSGPHSYISPSWYAAPSAVPTWNYVSVHLYGTVKPLSSDETLKAVEELVTKYEPELLVERDVVTNAFRDKLLPNIVGFKVEISRFEGVQKLGQHRRVDDQAGVYRGLSSSGEGGAQNLARYMREKGIGIGVGE